MEWLRNAFRRLWSVFGRRDNEAHVTQDQTTESAHVTTTGNKEFGSVQDVTVHQHPEPAPINVQPLAENLQSQLVDRSKQVVGESNMPIQLDRKIEPVRLEVLDIRNNCSVTIGGLFDKAFKKAQTGTKFISIEATNIVWVVGPPGVGKTTLLKMMVNQILKDELAPDIKYPFFINVKDIDFNKEVTLLEFLTTNSRVKVNYTEEESKALITFLRNNPNVAIFFDGLDEASLKKLVTGYGTCELDGKSKPVIIMKNVFNFTLLPNAKIVVTSTPDHLHKLHHFYGPTSIFKVLGLLEEAKKNLGTQLCGEKYPAIKKILDQQPNLAHLCYLPINFILIVFCLLSNEGSDIKTMTQVLIFSMTRFVESSHLEGEVPLDKVGAEMAKLAHLAYKGLQQRKLVFEKSDFEEVELADEMVTNFFHTYVDKSSGLRMKILDGNKRSYFTHLIWQEFYAAVYLLLFVSYREFEQLKSTFKDTQWSVVVKFMFGICNPHAYKQLKLIFPATMIKDYEEKKKFMESMMMESMMIELMMMESMMMKLMMMESLSSARGEDLIRRFGWLHEYNDDKSSKKFEDCIPVELGMKLPSHLAEVGDIVYALKSFTKPHKLRLNSNRTTIEVLEALLRGIHGTTTTITRLSINYIEMKDSLMESLLLHLDAMERLHFQYVGNLTVYMKRLSNAINQRSNKIQLELVQQKLCGRDAIYLAGCLGNISRLEMSHTVILKEHCSVLKKAIQQLPSIQDFELVCHESKFGSGSRELVEWFKEFKRRLKEKPGIMYEVVGSSHEAFPSSNDETSHPSISEPQPTVSSQDVSTHATFHQITRLSTTLNSQDVSVPALTQFESSSKCWIGSRGGKLEVGGCELVVPPGALEEDVEIKLTASLPLESEYLETPKLHCEPASLTFKTKVTIKLQTHVVLDKETIRRCKLLHSEDGITWEETETKLKFSDNFISFQTLHFSWWKGIFGIIEKGLDLLYKAQLNFLLYQDAGAVHWKVCWNLDLTIKENTLIKNKFSQETWIIPGGNDLILCIAPCEENPNVEIIQSKITIPADQINKSCHFDRRFEVQGQFSNRIWLKAERDCGSLHEEELIWFPLPSTQGQQPTNQIVNMVGNKLDHAVVLGKDVNIQSSSSKD